MLAFKGEVQLESAELAHTIVDTMDDRQAADIVMLDIRSISLITDYFVIGTGETRRQLSAITDSILRTVRENSGNKPLAIEGAPESGWIILDYGDVVVHVFAPEEREYYKLEQFWEEATLVVRIQ
ncbi:MAG: ribosome silencing factor [Anaerolineae bacterium]